MTTNVQSQEERYSDRSRMTALIAMGLVVLLSLIQVFIAAFVIPRFSAGYRELGYEPLPPSTALVLRFRWLLLGFAFVWPLVASFVVLRRASLLYLFVILVLLILPISFTTIALFLPISSGTHIRWLPPPQ